MKLENMTCPACGAPLKREYGSNKVICEYCGSSVLLDKDEIKLVEEPQHVLEKCPVTNMGAPKAKKGPTEKDFKKVVIFKKALIIFVLGLVVIFLAGIVSAFIENPAVIDVVAGTFATWLMAGIFIIPIWFIFFVPKRALIAGWKKK